MVCLGERVQDALAHTSPRGELKVRRAPPDATCVRACVPLQSSLAANPLFLGTFCCPRWAAWISLWASPCALTPAMMAKPPLLAAARANPLKRSRKWRADGDGCVEFAPDAEVAHGLRV